MPAKNNDIKPGWKTTEFWLTCLTVLASLLWGADVVDPDSAGTANKVFGFVVAALGADIQGQVEDCDCIATSFPSFFSLLSDLGCSLEAV